MAGRLQDKIALVTGATTGMGYAMAKRFIAEGAHVIVVARSGEQERVASELGERATAAHAEMASSDDLRRLFEMVERKFGRLDILFNNAGTPGAFTTLVEIPEETIDQVLDVNTRAVLLASKYAIPLMQKTGGGSIINTSSSSGLRSEPLLVAYSASKGGVIALTYSLARELGPLNIRVNTICPGPVDTELFRKHVDEVHYKRLQEETALRRVGCADEVATVALFYASDDSSFVTGTCLPVDGGFIC